MLLLGSDVIVSPVGCGSPWQRGALGSPDMLDLVSCC
jgi:hypothetical protein